MTKQNFDVTIVEQKIKSSVVASVKQKKRRRRKRQVGTNGTQPTTTTVNKTQIIYIASTNNSINVSNYFQNNNNNTIAGQQVESALLWPAVEGGQCNASVCSSGEKCMLNDNNTLNCVGCATLGNNPNINNNDAYRTFFFCSAATTTTTPKPSDNRNLLGLIAIPSCVIALILIIVLVVCLLQRRSKRKKNQDIHKIHPAVYEATDAGVLDRVNFENNENGGTVRSEAYRSRGGFDSVRSGRNRYENDNDEGLY
ncbi:hypothetical protein HELRODRAFT_193626 [Helobdella robusta]|uniref:Uncharacterized protein n=1 Tax=Helobdella robusta TaxID=6412 RepID=T1FV73_HELRO|nr:hypothetical protein HELRODRAFT_193626 [Helobdella robusta]ESN95307.1 hypothetical protein HELRODRAFT_193626 [Helobdella robusta]